jgi:hypothetical protein
MTFLKTSKPSMNVIKPFPFCCAIMKKIQAFTSRSLKFCDRNSGFVTHVTLIIIFFFFSIGNQLKTLPNLLQIFWNFNRNSELSSFLCLTNYTLRHEDVWGSGCIDPHFLDFATSWKCPFTPGERALGIHWIGAWVSPRAGLDDAEKRKIFPRQGL